MNLKKSSLEFANFLFSIAKNSKETVHLAAILTKNNEFFELAYKIDKMNATLSKIIKNKKQQQKFVVKYSSQARQKSINSKITNPEDLF